LSGRREEAIALEKGGGFTSYGKVNLITAHARRRVSPRGGIEEIYGGDVPEERAAQKEFTLELLQSLRPSILREIKVGGVS